MTLLIASKESGAVWMLSDTAITGGNISLRDRIYWPKIESAQGSSLLGFAGDYHHGQRIIREAASFAPGRVTLDFLVENHRQVPSADFAYAYWVNDAPHLFRIANGSVEEVQTLYLGDKEAFEKFQALRHGRTIDHAPQAIHQFICGARDPDVVPKGLTTATLTMLHLFPTRNDHSVGGWAVPWLLTKNGASLCTYCYSVTDPIADDLSPGMVIPHGTAEKGGFGMSFVGLRENDGMVIYWPQHAAGRVYVQAAAGYEMHEFKGGPSQFKDGVRSRLGREVDVWFGEEPLGTPHSVHYLRDDQGRPRFAIAQDEKNLSFAWVQSTDDSFAASGAITLDKKVIQSTPNPSKPMRLDMALAPDRQTATLEMAMNETVLGHIVLDAASVEGLISSLANVRASMAEPVTPEIDPGTELRCIIDPIWRTRIPPHPSVPGPLLALRHPGLGWLSFILPDTEARALGQWLMEHARPELGEKTD